jgi:hypothetical protein
MTRRSVYQQILYYTSLEILLQFIISPRDGEMMN